MRWRAVEPPAGSINVEMNRVHEFVRSVELPVSAEEAFAWHERPGALDRLIPPWEKVTIVRRAEGLGDGQQVELVNKLGPIPLRWVVRHHGYEEGRCFRDRQIAGPFAEWEHTHRFEPLGERRALLEDRIQYRLPGGRLGAWLGERLVRERLERMFDYRHQTTLNDLSRGVSALPKPPMSVAVTGASGLIGAELCSLLTTSGRHVTRVTRNPRAGDGAVVWDPESRGLPVDRLSGVDAVAHLAAENIAAGRWTKRRKRLIEESRVRGTRVLCESLARMPKPPSVLVAASAIGYYGDQGEHWLDEQSPVGEGFLAEVARRWEEATAPAVEAGIRVVRARFGLVLSPRGGALRAMLPAFRLGVAGRVGSGRQYFSWIGVHDAAGAIAHAIGESSLRGAVNVVSPNPVTNLEFTQTLGRVLGRPTLLPAPRALVRLALGEMADELLLASMRVRPNRLLESGYTFRDPDLEGALRRLLGKA